MKFKLLALIALSLASAACTDRPANSSAPVSPKPVSTTPATLPSPTVAVTSTPQDGDYKAKGVVTKIDMKLGSVEIDHEDIKDLMPPMKMEFYVSDKKMLDTVKVGDRVDFTIRYKGGQETVVQMKKAE